MTDGRVALGVDVGGTFTDVVLETGEGLASVKVPTTEADQSEGVMAGIRAACDRAGVDPGDVDRFRHASTVATNALIEGEGATVALVTTEGFADVLEIGRQDRPALYDLSARRPDPLVPAERRIEVPERATPEGVTEPVDEAALASLTDAVGALSAEVDAVAVCFLHAYADPSNEARAAAALEEALGVHLSVSHEVLGTVREYERTATTVADAALTPVVADYLGRLGERAAAAGLPAPRVMQSNGGIAAMETVCDHAVTTALSGPAAGVVGAALFEPPDGPGVVTLDMGGTSCDVGLVRDGEVDRTTEADVGGRPVRVPMVDVETVGAGGGSVAWVDDGGALRVGPRSAGAQPGPACYDRGGDEPTVTDAALVRGHLGAGTTLGGTVDLAADRAEAVLGDLAAAADLGGPAEAARGVVRVATARMARAIRTVTAERGQDPREFGIVAFGGAGPMHAAAIAERLGIECVLVPPASGVLSALGLLAADERHDASRSHRTRLAAADEAAVDAVYEALAERALAATARPAEAELAREAACRYAGQSHELEVPAPAPFDADALTRRFHAAHERVRGYALRDEPVELVTCRTTALVTAAPPEIAHEGTGAGRLGTRPATFGDRTHETPVFDRGALAQGATLDGPAILEGGESTTVVPPGWGLRVDGRGTLVLEVEE